MSVLETTSEEELTIDSIHGLKAFLSYVEDAYLAFEAQIQVVNSPLGPQLTSQVEAIYAEINLLIVRYTKILDWGGEISAEQIETLQQLYNKLIEAYDSLHTAEAASSKVALINQIETATFLLERGVRLLEEFSEIQTTPLRSSAIQAGKTAYAALQENCTDAKLIFDAIEASVETTSLEDAVMIATSQAQGLTDIESTFDSLEAELKTLFESGALEDVAKPVASQSISISNHTNLASRKVESTSVLSPFIKQVMAYAQYATVIKEAFSSPSAFEAALRREVYRVEAPSKLDALLGVKHGSAFLFLKDMTLAEIDVFNGAQNRQVVRAALSEKNIPYEIFMNWMEAIPYMESLVETSNEMTFGELFVSSEVELLIDTL